MGLYKSRSDYFKSICASNKRLLHNDATRKVWMRLNDMAESDAALWKNAHTTVVLHETMNSRWALNGNTAMANISHTFFVLTKAGTSADSIEAAKDNAFTVAKQIVSRLFKDIESGVCSFLVGIDNISIDEYPGEYGPKYMGWQLSFTEQPAGNDLYAKYDASEWQ